MPSSHAMSKDLDAESLISSATMLPHFLAPVLFQSLTPTTWTPKHEAITGCHALSKALPGAVFFRNRNDTVYEYEAAHFWSANELMNPGCVFRPTCAGNVARAVEVMERTGTQFAVRGGGHMDIKIRHGANNIDDGPLLFVMSNLTTLEVNIEEQYVWVGPGLNWGQVYSYLAQFNLTAAGGRLFPVGVPGLLLGGGMNAHGNQHGFAADNVIEYEVVLAALKGGSSNFGIVTKFKLRTFPSTLVLAGLSFVDDVPAFLRATANFIQYNTDPLAHVVSQVIAQGNSTIGAAILWYDSPTEASPACFAPFFDIPASSSTVAFKTHSTFADETGALFVGGRTDTFVAGTHIGKTYEDLLRGVEIVADVFLSAVLALQAIVPEEDLGIVCIDWQPIGALWAEGSRKADPGGNAFGFDPEMKGTYMAGAEVVEWKNSKYDEQVGAWVRNTTEAIVIATKATGLWDPFLYMGDATGFQDVLSSYGEDIHRRLLRVSRKYDLKRVFQRLLPGGLKIGL